MSVNEIVEWLKSRNKEENLRSTINESFYASQYTYNTDVDLCNQYLSIDEDFSNFKAVDDPREKKGKSLNAQIAEWIFTVLSLILMLCTVPFSLFFTIKFCSAFEKIVILRLGHVKKVAGPGIVFVLPCIDKYKRVDIRTYSIELNDLSVITADKGVVEVKAVVFAQVTDPLMLVCTLTDKDETLKTVAHSTLYNKISKSTISDVKHPRSLARIVENVNEIVQTFVKNTGVTLSEISITEVKVAKEGDNTTLNTFKQIMKSDAGKQMMGMFGDILKDVAGVSNLPPGVTQMFMPPPSSQPDPSVITMGFPTQAQPKPEVGDDILGKSSNPALNRILTKVKMCCDEAMVSKIRKRYRIVCDCGTSVDFIDLDLTSGEGSIAVNIRSSFTPDVTFTLSLTSLSDLVCGDLNPLTGYLNGSIKIEGSVEDAVLLKHLSEKAKQLKLT